MMLYPGLLSTALCPSCQLYNTTRLTVYLYVSEGKDNAHTLTFEKVDLLFAMVTWCWYGKSCVNVVRNLLEAHRDVPRVVVIQNIILKAPVLIPLRGYNPVLYYCIGQI